MLFGEPILLGLLRYQLAADEIVQRLVALLGRELARRLASDALHVELEEVFADRLAIDGGGGRRPPPVWPYRRVGALRLAGAEGKQPRDEDDSGIFMLISQ